MITLYGTAGSRSTRALWALEETGQPYAYVSVDLANCRAGDRPLSDLNPACKVPVLEEGPFILTESMAICLHVADRDPGKALLPETDSGARAHLLQWCSFVIGELEQPLWTLAKHTFILPPERRVPGVRETAVYELDLALSVLETGLGARAWILGDRFTAADILIADTLGWANVPDGSLSSPALLRYLERARNRPAYARARDRETHGADPAA